MSGVPRGNDLRNDPKLDVKTWAVSRERDSYLDRRGRTYIYAIGGGVVALGSAILFAGQDAPGLSYESLWRTVASAFAFVGLLVVVYSAVPYFSARSAYRQRRLATASAKVDQAITRASEGADGQKVLQTGQLFELNRRQLDEYQLITRKQQRSAFLLAQGASAVAFAVLVGGIFIALSADEPVDKYLTTGLTALGSLLSGFLAATFFSSAKDANDQMNRYYLEPQRTGRLLAAERILTQIKPDGASRAEIISAVLSWEMPHNVASSHGEPVKARMSEVNGQAPSRDEQG